MKIKHFATVLLSAAIGMGLCACSNQKKTETTQTDRKRYDKVVYAYASFNNIPDSETLKTVDEAINKITRKKIGVEVELMPIAIADYSSSVSLALQGGDKIDVFESLGDFNTSVSSHMAYDLTNIIDTCAPETKKLVGDDLLLTCKKDGKLYGIPSYKPFALTPMIIYKKEIADKLGIDMNNIKKLSELTAVLHKVKQAYPDMTPLVPVQQGSLGTEMSFNQVDYLTDNYYKPKGVLIGNSMKVIDLYGTEQFKNICNLARTWYNEGLLMKEAATTTSTAAELMSNDNSFCYIASYSYPPADTAASLEPQCGGKPLGAVQIGSAYLDTTSINVLSWMVSSTSKVPEAALKFLNLTFTDKNIINLIIYGLKDRDYVMDADGYVTYPVGKDAASVPYTAQLSCGTLGNFFLMYPMKGTKKESLAWEEEQNKKADRSPAMGFTFDAHDVKTEYTAVSNVIQQYLPGLICGSLDPETVIPVFREKLSTAGLDTIIEAKQKQLDAWLQKK